MSTESMREGARDANLLSALQHRARDTERDTAAAERKLRNGEIVRELQALRGHMALLRVKQEHDNFLQQLEKFRQRLHSAMRSQQQDVRVNGARHPGLLEPMAGILESICADFDKLLALDLGRTTRTALERMTALDEAMEAEHPGWMTGGTE